MIESLVPWYLWLKAIHFISVIAWMAGLLYLPRLFVYHTGVKLLLVLALGALHGMMARYRKDFERRQNRRTQKFYRVFNEIPAALMIAIVLLAVLKPF